MQNVDSHAFCFFIKLISRNIPPVTYLGYLEDQYTSLGAQKKLSRFSFFSCISTKNKLKINDFTMGLIVWNSLENNNADRQENNETERHQSKSRKLSIKMFSLIYLTNDALLFLLDFLRTCSCSLIGVNSLQYFVWSLLYYLLHLFSSDCFTVLTTLLSYKFFSQAYSLTNFYLDIWIF